MIITIKIINNNNNKKLVMWLQRVKYKMSDDYLLYLLWDVTVSCRFQRRKIVWFVPAVYYIMFNNVKHC